MKTNVVRIVVLACSLVASPALAQTAAAHGAHHRCTCPGHDHDHDAHAAGAAVHHAGGHVAAPATHRPHAATATRHTHAATVTRRTHARQ